MNTAMTALLQTPDDSTLTLNFADVKQAPDETFSKFAECLKNSNKLRV